MYNYVHDYVYISFICCKLLLDIQKDMYACSEVRIAIYIYTCRSTYIYSSEHINKYMYMCIDSYSIYI